MVIHGLDINFADAGKRRSLREAENTGEYYNPNGRGTDALVRHLTSVSFVGNPTHHSTGETRTGLDEDLPQLDRLSQCCSTPLSKQSSRDSGLALTRPVWFE